MVVRNSAFPLLGKSLNSLGMRFKILLIPVEGREMREEDERFSH
jgi:hypothetical protein